MGHIGQSDLDTHTQVGATVHALARTATTTESAEASSTESAEVKPGTKHRVQDIIDVKSAKATTGTAHLLIGEAKLVVALTLLGVTEHAVGLGRLLEFLFSVLLLLLGLALLAVGMILDCQLAIGLLQLIGRSILLYAQYLVVISFVSHNSIELKLKIEN